ncbi:MAG: DNA-binding protein WhiA [Eubacteriales bacterium]|uniref:DNA-binding protein WhiA n=1 Tax=Baileyella intestinalis TaxID=2606709 RepID=UPI002A75BFA2|nr:DNA-binding protein WhiA [Baileyella intestinalis]MCI7685690.1 DNA-binding protein WhiA [Clostridiales bacterium]MDY2995031.1 DNA-binding protein WhiA [Baileyella intestinalis]
MSFSSELKGELARINVENKDHMLAEISGFLRVSGSLRLAGGGKFSILAATENPAVARHYKMLIRDYFDCNPGLEVGMSQMPGKAEKKGYRYALRIRPEDKSEKILRETGMMLIREGNDYLSDGIYQPIVRNKGCKKAYIRGLFLGCGTISDPHKGYHMEFVLDSKQVAWDLKKLIGTFTDLSASVTERGSDWVVYIKKADYIGDMLGIMGASNSMLEFENIKIERGIKGEAARIANCDNANVDRALNASERQLRDIRVIQEKMGIDGLPEQLRQVAVLRLERPEASLTEIGEALNPPIQKGGVNKRFRRIHQLAEETLGEE